MIKPLLISVVFLSLPFLSSAQHDTLRKSEICKTWITLGGGSETQGILYQITDSAVQITNSFIVKDLLSGKYQITKINYNNISVIETWSIRKFNRGVLYGAFAGTMTGMLIGFSLGSDGGGGGFTASDKAVMLGILGFLGGTLVGTFVGLASIKIPIYGSFDNFNKNKSRLKKHSYIH
jgi:hypothetical protein